MNAGLIPPEDRMEEERSGLFTSTGVKMFLILTLALLPLGLIALFASLQAIRSADLEKEALLRVSATQSARKLSAALQSDRTALDITANALAAGTADKNICQRLSLFLGSHDGGGRFYIYRADGTLICGASRDEPAGVSPSQRFARADLEIVAQSRELLSRTISRDRQVVALTYYAASELSEVTDPATALQSHSVKLSQGDRTLTISDNQRSIVGKETALSAPVDPWDVTLTIAVHEPPTTLARSLSLFLPLVTWFAAAAIGWYVVNRLLIRPLVNLRQAVSAYRPGEVMSTPPPMRTPAREIIDLGETFRAISMDVASHEAEMAESLDTQRKLTREVHHRVKNNLQIIASLISLHARSARDPEAIAAYATIQRRVDALSVVHRNHFAELEENRGVGIRPLISELSASLRGTAPADARRFVIQIECDNFQISQDVAVPVAFLVTELVELAMMLAPNSKVRIAAEQSSGENGEAVLIMTSPALMESGAMETLLDTRYGRVLTGLSRQMRAPLDYDGSIGRYAITIRTLS